MGLSLGPLSLLSIDTTALTGVAVKSLNALAGSFTATATAFATSEALVTPTLISTLIGIRPTVSAPEGTVIVPALFITIKNAAPPTGERPFVAGLLGPLVLFTIVQLQ